MSASSIALVRRYLTWTQRKKQYYVSNSMVRQALEAEVLEGIEEVSVEDMHRALLEVEAEEGSERRIQQGHAGWVVAHYAMEVEKKLSEETAKKVWVSVSSRVAVKVVCAG